MIRLSDYRIQTRLYTLVIFSCVGLGGVLALASYQMYQYRINGPVYRKIALYNDFGLEISPPTLSAGQAYLVLQELETETNPEEIRRLKDRFADLESLFEKRHAEFAVKLPEGDSKRQLAQVIKPGGQEIFRIARDEFLPLVGKKEDQAKASEVLGQRIRPKFRKHRAAVDDVIAAMEKETEQIEQAAAADSGFWMNAMVVLSIASISLLAFFGITLARGIVRSTNTLIGRVEEMAGGASDLTARIPIESKDELGQLGTGINHLISKIQTVVSKVRESSIQVLATASQISATAQQQYGTVAGLNSSGTQIAAAVREISQTGRELSATMDDVHGRANNTATLAVAGRERLVAMEQTMGQLVESTASISAKLATIREKADTINMVVVTITKVADQTNLLSINAAIEAEKAGEFGRGFLVVAREIRRLADQTAVATLDIESMVRLMQDAVASGVMQMDKFSDQVRSSVGRVAEINGQTGQIISEVTGLGERFRFVNEGMRNQTIGAEQIDEAMGNMAGNIRQTASALDEFNRATAHLRSSIEQLNAEIASFKV